MQATQSDAVSFHDGLATKWEENYKSARFAARLSVLEKVLPDSQAGKRWLDAGCGTGTVARWLAGERGATVTAVDASKQMLANAQTSAGVTYINGDVMHSGLRECIFDGVVCSSVLEYLDDPQATLSQFARLLKLGGVLLVSVPHAAPSVRIPLRTLYWLTVPLGKFRLYRFLDYSKHCYSISGISELLSRCGFAPTRVVDFARINFYLPLKLRFPGALLMAEAIKLGTSL